MVCVEARCPWKPFFAVVARMGDLLLAGGRARKSEI